MKRQTHTPGPWNADLLIDEVGKSIPIYAASNKGFAPTVALVLAHGIPSEIAHADARLIAAAPEMLTWLKELLKQLKRDHPTGMDGIKEHVSKLIARAEGRDGGK